MRKDSDSPRDETAKSVPLPKRSHLGEARDYVITGALVAVPAVCALWLTLWLFRGLDGRLLSLFPDSWRPEVWAPYPLPGFGLFLGVLAMTLLGWVSAGFLGRFFAAQLEREVITRLPVVGSLYFGLKQAFSAIFREKGTAFRRVVALRAPHEGVWTLALATAPPPPALLAHLPADSTGLFLPAVPNPTTGFLLFASEKDLHTLSMPVEQGIRLIVSGGIITPDALEAEPQPRPVGSLFRVIRRKFIGGILVGAPVFLTLWICWQVISWFDNLVGPLFPPLYVSLNPWVEIPGMGIVLMLLFLFVLGFLVRGWLGHLLTTRLNMLLSHIPFVGPLHSALRSLMEAFFSPKGKAFRSAVLFPYPRPGIWAIGFITAEENSAIHKDLGDQDTVNVFMPTTPNPTTGFFMMVPRSQLRYPKMSVEDAFRLVLSIGLSGTEGKGG